MFALEIFLLWGFFGSAAAQTPQKGLLDLRHFDFYASPSISLNGEWAFAFNRYARADKAFPSEQERGAQGYPVWSQVPQHWGKLRAASGERLPDRGTATYHLHILLPPVHPPLGLLVQSPATAAELWVNGVLMGQLGRVGDTLLTTHPQLGTLLVPLDPLWNELDVRLVVSNWEGRRGGFWKPMTLGNFSHLQWNKNVSEFIRLFWGGSMLLMSLYHLILFLYRRRDGIHLQFSSFALVGLLRLLIPGDHLIRALVPWMSYYSIIRIEYATLLLALGMLYNFLREFYPQLVPARISRAFMILGGIYALFALFAPFQWVHNSVGLTQIINACGGLGVVIYAFCAWKSRLNGSDLLLASILLLYAAVINDILQSRQIVHTGYWVSYALFFLIFVQWLLLAQRYSNSYQLLEIQREQFLSAIADAIESRDQYTGGHVNRVASFSRDLALAIGLSPQYARELYYASMVHDVGKIGIRDEILNKPGKFTDEEMEIMKSHTLLGYQILHPLEDSHLAAEIAHFHQERWNGSGYPLGLKGEEIPLHARIVAVADFWDAISSDRPYRKAFPLSKCVAILIEEWDRGLDPNLVETFLLEGIWTRYLQNEPDPVELECAEALIRSHWPSGVLV